MPRGSLGLIFAPYLTGERNPHPDPLARGAFVGLTLRHGIAHMARAVMEGVAFGMRDNLELLRAQGVQPSEAVIGGGATSSPVWRQLTADIMGIPLYTVNTHVRARPLAQRSWRQLARAPTLMCQRPAVNWCARRWSSRLIQSVRGRIRAALSDLPCHLSRSESLVRRPSALRGLKRAHALVVPAIRACGLILKLQTDPKLCAHSGQVQSG